MWRGSRFFFVLAVFLVSADKLPARNDKTQQAQIMAVCWAFIVQTELQTELQTGISGELQPACNKMKCRDGRKIPETRYICNTKFDKMDKHRTQTTRAVLSRENILMISACVTLTAAIGFSVAGFIVPPLGEIHDSVLWITGQFLFYTGGALGISTYTYYGFKRMQAQLNHRLRSHGHGAPFEDNPYAEADGIEPETDEPENDEQEQ